MPGCCGCLIIKIYKMELKKISEVQWEIPIEGKMNVPGKIFASEKLLLDMKKDNTLQQVKNVACLPGILKASIAMSDAHNGYGFPIGGVAAFDIDKGIISPGGVGYDINCSVRLLRTNLTLKDIESKGKKEILHSLFRSVPSGVGRGSEIKLSKKELDDVLTNGAQWAVPKGYGTREDYINTEEGGKLEGANPDDVSERAKARGMPQLGSLGAGNHFLEVQIVDKIYDLKIAKIFGLSKGMITIMIHCGSRGLGHQVASDYIKLMEEKYSWPSFDRELVNAPIKSELGKKYLSAMKCAANFAFANKQMITHWIREDLKHYFPEFSAEVVYDVCHNIAKFEKHIIDGNEKEVLVMRKGATRSFGPGRIEIPKKYRDVGGPVIIPGSMGTASYILVGTKKAEEISFGSTAHGAGRVSSRTSARNNIRGEDVKSELAKRGIDIEAGSFKGLSEEAPEVYKDIDEVVRVSHVAGIGKLVARLSPVAVMKG
jgi:tRNA-splicing ligase RtcB (3'-phosphate/5'-hydroxy nucleic acid ligase)